MGDDGFFQPDLVPKQNTNSLQYLFPNAVPIRHLFSPKNALKAAGQCASQLGAKATGAGRRGIRASAGSCVRVFGVEN